MNAEPSKVRPLTILVEEQTTEFVPRAGTPEPQTFGPEAPGSQTPAPGILSGPGPSQWLRERVVKDKLLNLSDVREQLERVEAQIDGLLAGLQPQAEAGFRLTQVHVQVGITGNGSIGIVSAGVQASVTLIYTRP